MTKQWRNALKIDVFVIGKLGLGVFKFFFEINIKIFQVFYVVIMPYILEVQRFDSDGHLQHPEWNGKAEHIGYMNKIFRTKWDACHYYDNQFLFDFDRQLTDYLAPCFVLS
jgi:hypothetical protein